MAVGRLDSLLVVEFWKNALGIGALVDIGFGLVYSRNRVMVCRKNDS